MAAQDWLEEKPDGSTGLAGIKAQWQHGIGQEHAEGVGAVGGMLHGAAEPGQGELGVHRQPLEQDVTPTRAALEGVGMGTGTSPGLPHPHVHPQPPGAPQQRTPGDPQLAHLWDTPNPHISDPTAMWSPPAWPG